MFRVLMARERTFPGGWWVPLVLVARRFCTLEMLGA